MYDAHERVDESRDATQLEELPAIFSYAEARAAGLSRRRIYWLRDHGLINALARGTYMRASAQLDTDPDLADLATRSPRATICLASALARHDLTDAIPATTDLAIPRGQRRPATTAPVTWHAFAAGTFDIGRDVVPLTGNIGIGLYNAERSIIDAFRLRHQEGDELAYEALRRWLRRRNTRPAELVRMAERFPKALPALRAALAALL